MLRSSPALSSTCLLWSLCYLAILPILIPRESAEASDCFTLVRTLPAPGSNTFALGYGDDNMLWVRDQDGGLVYRLDPQTGAVLQSFPTGGYADLDVRDGILYELDEPTIRRYDTATGTQLSSLNGPVTGGARGLTFVGSELYVSGAGFGSGVSLGHVDPATGALLGFSTPADITDSEGIGAFGNLVGFLFFDEGTTQTDVILRLVDPATGATVEDHPMFPWSGWRDIWSLDTSATELFVSRRDVGEIWVYSRCNVGPLVIDDITPACPLPTAIQHSDYIGLVQFSAAGGTPPYTWSAAGLPTGMNINAATGELEGPPTDTGLFSFTVTVRDFLGAEDTRDCSLNVASGVADPAQSSVPSVLINPDGSLDYIVTVRDTQGTPVSGSQVSIVISAAADALVCWCVSQEHPVITAVTDAAGNATFNIRGGGCVDPEELGSVPAEVFADEVLLAGVGIVSPDVLHGNRMPTSPGAVPCGTCDVDMRDSEWHLTVINSQANEFCGDVDGDGVTALGDAVLLTVPLAKSSVCVSAQGPCVDPPGPSTNAKIALHVRPQGAQNCLTPSALGVAYSDIVTSAPVGVPTQVYVLVAGVDQAVGISGVTFDVDFDPAKMFTEWHACGAWMSLPELNLGHQIVWRQDTQCQTTVLGSDGAHAIAGMYYVYAYEASIMQVVAPPKGPATVMDCNGRLNEVETCLGAVGFGLDGSSQSLPILPSTCGEPTNNTGPPWVFTGVPPRRWLDPPDAYGFRYEMTSASLFTKVVDFPTGFPNPFTVSVEGIVLGTNYSPGDSVVFSDFAGSLGSFLVNGVGVHNFEITEISPQVDSNDPLAFPVRLDFDTPTADLTMTPLLEPVVLAIPNPDVQAGNPLSARNYPNPFSPATLIHYVLPARSPVSVMVYDYQGRLVRALVRDLDQSEGEHVVRWDGRDESGRNVPAGVYFYKVVTLAHTVSRKMVLTR